MPLLAPRADLAELQAEYRQQGRVRVPQLLAEPLLQRLRERVLSWPEWARVTRLAGEHRTFDAAAMDQMDAATRAAFDAHVAAEARRGFQYLFDRYALIDRGDAGQLADPVLLQAYQALRSESLLELVRQISGDAALDRVDGQLTRYRPGHFLSAHDDSAPSRRVAYSLSLSAGWQPEQGGQLQFLDATGEPVCNWSPTLNALSLFAVPQAHHVLPVAFDAPASRFAITGWFHSPS